MVGNLSFTANGLSVSLVPCTTSSDCLSIPNALICVELVSGELSTCQPTSACISTSQCTSNQYCSSAGVCVTPGAKYGTLCLLLF